jgi:D-allose transport system substrate-binding protein
VASQPADWDRLRALDVATNIMQRTPDLAAFYCCNDTMALGAMQAVQNLGKAGKVIVVGTDGIPEAIQMIQAGRMTATVAQDPAKVGATGLDLLVDAVKSGKQIGPDAEPKFVPIDSILVTKK